MCIRDSFFKSLQQIIRKFADGWFEGIGSSLVPWHLGTCASRYSDTRGVQAPVVSGNYFCIRVPGYLGTQVSRYPGTWVQVITLVPGYLVLPGYLGVVPGYYLDTTWVLPGYSG